MWWGDDGAYVVSSYARPDDDGSAQRHDGQVWFLDPRAGTLTLEILFTATDNQDDDPDGPDNITVSPYGEVIIAENGEGQVYLLGATPGGEIYFLAHRAARTRTTTRSSAGRCSHRTRALFANLQGPRYVFAIRGPFVEQV